MQSERYQIGWNKLAEVDGEQGERVIEALQDIAPDFAEILICMFGDIYSRKALDLKAREIATIASLAALGNATPQLKVHIHGALNVGCSPQEIVEVMMQMAAYAGFPAALNGLFAAKDVFAERGVDISEKNTDSQFQRGYFVTAELRITDANRVEETMRLFKELCAITREEAGCTLFELHEFPENPTKLMLWERFDSEEDFHAHHKASYTIALKEKGLTEIVNIYISNIL